MWVTNSWTNFWTNTYLLIIYFIDLFTECLLIILHFSFNQHVDFILIYMTKNFTQLWAGVYQDSGLCLLPNSDWGSFLKSWIPKWDVWWTTWFFFFLPRLHTDGLTAESTLRIKWMFNLNLLSLPWFYFRTQTMFHRFPIISKDILSNIFFFTTLKGNKPEPLVWLVICFRYHCWKNRDISDLFHLTECWHLVGEQILVNIKSNDTAKTNHV